MSMTDLETLEVLLKNVDTTAICDADKTTRTMSAEIRCRSANPAIFGPAFTVRCREDFFAVARAIEEAPAGHVIVVDGGGSQTALAGELFARAALVRGLAGIIVDGGYRDIAYISQSPLPVYSRYVKPMAGTTGKLGELQVPVSCGGVTVLPGDLVIADVEGVVVIDPRHAERLLRAAEVVKANEVRVIARLDAGLSLSAGLTIEEHADRLRNGEPSTLQFVD
jgi:4-hydroxy-4-methyl-2-oxoglutarate aldolase